MLQAFRPVTLLKGDFNTGVFLWILWNFIEHLFWRTSANRCFCQHSLFTVPLLTVLPYVFCRAFKLSTSRIQLKIWLFHKHLLKLVNIEHLSLMNICYLIGREKCSIGHILLSVSTLHLLTRKWTEYLSIFSPNAGKYGSEKLRIRTLFAECKQSAFDLCERKNRNLLIKSKLIINH